LNIKIEDIWDNMDGSMPPIFPVQDDGIVIEKIRFIMPHTPESYKFIAEQIKGKENIDAELVGLIEKWYNASDDIKTKILDILKESMDK
jgi:hypothetical protein